MMACLLTRNTSPQKLAANLIFFENVIIVELQKPHKLALAGFCNTLFNVNTFTIVQ